MGCPVNKVSNEELRSRSDTYHIIKEVTSVLLDRAKMRTGWLRQRFGCGNALQPSLQVLLLCYARSYPWTNVALVTVTMRRATRAFVKAITKIEACNLTN